MHSTSIFSISSASALFALTQAAPVAQGTRSNLVERGIYSKCLLPSKGAGGERLYWDGECSSDPTANGSRGVCILHIYNADQWSILHQKQVQTTYGTKTPIDMNTVPTTPTQPPIALETPDLIEGAYYRCAASGFDGTCSYDPCDGKQDSWCEDYIWKSYTPKTSNPPSPAPSEPAGNGDFAPLTSYSKCTTSTGLLWDGFCTEKMCEKGLSWCK
jgi:hypothetical protein